VMKTFGFDFGEKYEVTFEWSQKFGISIWGLLRTVFQRKCEEHKVTSGWSQKRFKFQFEGYWEPCFENVKWHLVGHKRLKYQFEGYWEPFSKHSFYLHE
jgi:hypothetical protein